MLKVTLKGFITVPKDDITAILQELPKHIALTRKEAGCLVFNVTQDKHDIYKFYVYEEFASKVSFEKHQSRTKSSVWGDVTKNIKRYYKIDGV